MNMFHMIWFVYCLKTWYDIWTLVAATTSAAAATTAVSEGGDDAKPETENIGLTFCQHEGAKDESCH